MPIQTVFFDMGGTIDTFWFSKEMRLRVTPELQNLLSSAGVNLHLSDEQLYVLIIDGLGHYHQWRLQTLEELPVTQIWREYILADYPNSYPQLELLADDLMMWIETHYYERTMRPEMPMVLNAIQKMGCKIGLISNVASRGQVPFNLSQYGIKHYFNPIVLSSEYKRRKPDPSLFHYAARLANSPTSECLYVGDRISRDILEAKRAGYRLAVQIKHEFNHGESDEGAIPDAVITNMMQLLEIIKQENSSNEINKPDFPSENHIRAVLFDADGVLYFRKNKAQESNGLDFQGHDSGYNPTLSELDQLRHDAYIGRITFEQYKTAILTMQGITDPGQIEQAISRAKEEKKNIHFFDNTRTTLETLKNRKLYLGIVTDTAQPLHEKINKLERGGIGHLWDSIIPSCEVGVQKPSAEIYNLALNQLGVKPCQAVFVGHKTSELDGAKNIGMKTIAFNYDADATADIYIENITDLAKIDLLA